MILGVVVVLAAAGTWYGVHAYRAKAAAEGGYQFATIEFGDIEDLVSATGTLQPRDYVDVGAQVSGQIEDIYVEVGDVVEVGQKLAKIDATTSQARVDANRASMESRKTNLESQKTNLEKARRDYERQKNLRAEDATTEEALLNAETSFRNAERQVKSSQLDIQQQEANMRIEEKNLQYTDIVAPIAGTIMSIAVKKGQTVNASQNVPNVLRIANLGTMTVQSDVSEADVSRLYEGMPVYFTTLGGGNYRWTSVLKRKEPTPKTQQGVVLYPALFDIANEGGTLMPSMTAQVFFIAAEARNVLKLPMAAIQQAQQIQRELAQKEREAGKQPAAGAPGAPGAMPPGAARAAGAGAREGGSAPATSMAAAAGGAAPAAPAQGAASNRQANAQGGEAGGQRAGGQGGFNGQRPGGQGGQGGFGGQRPGGPGGFGGQRPGGRNFTPEQLAEFQRSGGGNFGNFRGGGGGFNRQGAMASAGGGAGPRPAQRRNATVMVKKEDGTLEARRIVYGVTDRVFGEVIEGLKEGEQVVVGKKEVATAARPATNIQNQNFNNQNFRGGNNFQGGGNFGGGGGRPF